MAGEQAGRPGPHQVVESYGGGRFRISGVIHEHSVIVLAERTLTWPVTRFEDITEESLAPVTGADIDILLLGCGPATQLVSPGFRAMLRGHGLALEAMDTGAAARTYNLLLAEGRRVAAALIAVG